MTEEPKERLEIKTCYDAVMLLEAHGILIDAANRLARIGFEYSEAALGTTTAAVMAVAGELGEVGQRFAKRVADANDPLDHRGCPLPEAMGNLQTYRMAETGNVMKAITEHSLERLFMPKPPRHE